MSISIQHSGSPVPGGRYAKAGWMRSIHFPSPFLFPFHRWRPFQVPFPTLTAAVPINSPPLAQPAYLPKVGKVGRHSVLCTVKYIRDLHRPVAIIPPFSPPVLISSQLIWFFILGLTLSQITLHTYLPNHLSVNIYPAPEISIIDGRLRPTLTGCRGIIHLPT